MVEYDNTGLNIYGDIEGWKLSPFGDNSICVMANSDASYLEHCDLSAERLEFK